MLNMRQVLRKILYYCPAKKDTLSIKENNVWSPKCPLFRDPAVDDFMGFNDHKISSRELTCLALCPESCILTRSSLSARGSLPQLLLGQSLRSLDWLA